MPIDRYTLKMQARESLNASRPNARVMTLLYFLLTSGISLLVGLFVEDPLNELQSMVQAGLTYDRAILLALSGVGMIGLFLNILVSLYSIVVEFGYRRWALGASRGQEGEFSDLIGGFSMAGRVILLQLEVVLYGMLWYLAIFLPAILVGVMLLMIPFAGVFFFVGVMVGALVLYFSRVLRYSMAVYCLADDPDSGAGAAIRRSRELMEGCCGSYFMLLFSFLGWQLLVSVIVMAAEAVVLLVMGGAQLWSGVMAGDLQQIYVVLDGVPASVVLALAPLPLTVWLTPYISITEAKFYDLIRQGRPAEQVHYRYE